MPKAKPRAKTYDRAAVLAVVKAWTQNINDSIERGWDPEALLGSAKTLAAILAIASEYEAREDKGCLAALNAIIAADGEAPNAVCELVDEGECVTVDVEQLVAEIEDGALD